MVKKKTELIGNFIEVEWLDACDKETQLADLEEQIKSSKTGEELLVINKTSGKLLAILPKVIIIKIEEDNQGGIQTIIIPKGWIIKPRELKCR
jgi:hypothetical protein